jgi:glycosyltransferase involved in cell wall biosynthesis
LALPSFVEGFGLVILEAFAMVKPVLVADVKPLSELVCNNIDGFVLPVDSPKKWAEKLIYILSNKKICKKMGKAGRVKVEKEYNLDRVVNNMESLYQSLLRE